MLAPATKVLDSVIEDSKFSKYIRDSESALEFANKIMGHEVLSEPFT